MLRHKDHLNPGGGGCSKLRLCHCTPAWQESKTVSQKNEINKRSPLPFWAEVSLNSNTLHPVGQAKNTLYGVPIMHTKKCMCWVHWLMPVVPATWDDGVRPGV